MQIFVRLGIVIALALPASMPANANAQSKCDDIDFESLENSSLTRTEKIALLDQLFHNSLVTAEECLRQQSSENRNSLTEIATVPPSMQPQTALETKESEHLSAVSSVGSQIGADKLKFAVAVIDTPSGSQGSGFVIDDGVLLTAEHVVRGARTVKLTFGDGLQISGLVETVNRSRDVARVRFPANHVRAVLKVRSANLKIGEDVYSYGAPAGLAGTLRKGIVSSIRPSSDGSFDLIQSDVGTNPGNSGGPLLDENYDVIGITSYGITQQHFADEGLNFFVPIDEALAVLGPAR